MRAEITKEQLIELLNEASAEHHAYEKKLDGKDDDWAGWCAEFIFSRLDEVSGAETANASTDNE